MELELTPALAVHVVDEAAGERLEQQAEDGHAGAEAIRVRGLQVRVEDADVDNVQEDGDCQANEELQDKPEQGPAVTSSVPCHIPSLSHHIPDQKLRLCPTVWVLSVCWKPDRASRWDPADESPDGTALLRQGLGLDPACSPARAPTTSCRP